MAWASRISNVGNTDDPVKARQETRLIRLRLAAKELEAARQRFEQIKRRVPGLKTIASGGLDNLSEALKQINAEFEETRQERWSAKTEP